ncbi:MAG: heavy-metal-associated domain-containing protein [Flavobacteriales bacterium]|nr:heavy-metal-associated domain-containing protein [Flavobacteriales bacterium]
MKRIKLIAGIAIGLFLTSCAEVSTTDTSNDTTEVFMVYGNCGMCEKTIEGSLSGVTGISSADWNPDDDMIKVSFNSSVIKLDDIKQKIADVGYDTDSHKSTDETYNALMGCCKYDRP